MAATSVISWAKTGDIEEEYELMEVVGQGLFGVVSKCCHRDTGKVCAAKKIDKRRAKRKLGKSSHTIADEVEILKKINHSHCMKLEEVFETRMYLYLVLEYVPGGELLHKMAQVDGSTEKDCISLIRGILEGLEYLHSLNIVHRDLKPENILLVEDRLDSGVKIIDFGLAYVHAPGTEPLRAFVGTPSYMSPEIFNHEGSSFASDIWAIGCISYLIVSGCEAFDGDDMPSVSTKISAYKTGDLAWETDFEAGGISENGKSFIKRLLSYDKKKRPTAKEALALPWLKNETTANKQPLNHTEKLRTYNAQQRWTKAYSILGIMWRFTKLLSENGQPASLESVMSDVDFQSPADLLSAGTILKNNDREKKASSLSTLNRIPNVDERLEIFKTMRDNDVTKKASDGNKDNNESVSSNNSPETIPESSPNIQRRIIPNNNSIRGAKLTRSKSVTKVGDIIKPLIEGKQSIAVSTVGLHFIKGINGCVYVHVSAKVEKVVMIYITDEFDLEEDNEINNNTNINNNAGYHPFSPINRHRTGSEAADIKGVNTTSEPGSMGAAKLRKANTDFLAQPGRNVDLPSDEEFEDEFDLNSDPSKKTTQQILKKSYCLNGYVDVYRYKLGVKQGAVVECYVKYYIDNKMYIENNQGKNYCLTAN